MLRSLSHLPFATDLKTLALFLVTSISTSDPSGACDGVEKHAPCMFISERTFMRSRPPSHVQQYPSALALIKVIYCCIYLEKELRPVVAHTNLFLEYHY